VAGPPALDLRRGDRQAARSQQGCDRDRFRSGGGGRLVGTLVLYDWFSAGHSALELPMAATSWAFGLDHFAQNGYLWRSIVVGALLVAGDGLVHGIVFGGLADRFLMLQTLPETIGAGIAWGFVSWLFFWDTLLPIARGGAPFRLI